VVLPHVGRLNDDDMSAYFPDYDGRWSRQTSEAMKKLGASGLELNANWALTRRIWSCPGCGRSKPEIFRKSESGILLAKLDLHHDHLWEEANRKPVEVLGPEWKERVRGGETIRDLVTRFNDALVCSECNAADGTAKRRLGIDARFSFAAEEIRQFVISVPHEDHRIDVEKAHAIWTEGKPGFKRRVALLDTLVDDLVAGRLQRRMEGMHPARPMFKRLGLEEILQKAFPDAVKNTSKDRLLEGMREAFLARSVQKDVVARRTGRPRTTPLGPSEEDYASYAPKANPTKWLAAGEDWTCPCCGRGKRGILRVSSKRQWSGSIRIVYQFDDLHDADEIALRERLLPDFENELHLAGRREVDVCSDCAEITPRLQQERRDVGEVYLTIEEMKSVLTEVGDHRRHEIDMEKAERLSLANRRLLAAARALDAFTSLKAAFQTKIGHAQRNPEARRWVFDDLDFLLRVEHRIDDQHERKALIGQMADLC
jgi:rubredoxin